MPGFNLPKTVFDTNGRPYLLIEEIGAGGQGTIFKEKSGQFVIKIAPSRFGKARLYEYSRRYNYLLNVSQTNHARLREQSHLVLPEALLAKPFVGYVMQRMRNCISLIDIIKTKAPDNSWYNETTGGLRRRLLLAGYISRAFHHIHLSGLAYCDISPRNILIDKYPAGTNFSIIDSDNLSTPKLANVLVNGTPHYIAPEILKGSHQPDAFTDSHSLAVIIFEMLRLVHPLIGGSQVDNGSVDIKDAALRGELPYIDNQNDASNRSEFGIPKDQVFTEGLIRLADRAFTEGLSHRTRRPLPSDWEEECLLAADKTLICQNCRGSFLSRPLKNDSKMSACPWCQEINQRPPMLVIYKEVMSQPGTWLAKKALSFVNLEPGINYLTARQLNGESGNTGDNIIARVTRDFKSGSLRMENTGAELLFIYPPSGTQPYKVKQNMTQILKENSTIFMKIPENESLVRYAKIVFPK